MIRHGWAMDTSANHDDVPLPLLTIATLHSYSRCGSPCVADKACLTMKPNQCKRKGQLTNVNKVDC
jgi:hypothetical protein